MASDNKVSDKDNKTACKVFVDTNICMEPKYINRNVSLHLMDKIRSLYNGRCDSVNGYVIKTEDDVKIIDNSVSSNNANVIFRVQFHMICVKPTIGQEYEGRVRLVLSDGHGVLVDIDHGGFRAIIPANRLPTGFRYDKSTSRFCRPGNTQPTTIAQGDCFTVVLEAVKYEQKKFNCIGSLKILGT